MAIPIEIIANIYVANIEDVTRVGLSTTLNIQIARLMQLIFSIITTIIFIIIIALIVIIL
jgi:hypothetical protein